MNDRFDTIVVRDATKNDWQNVRQLLVEAELPITDLGPDRLEHFLIAETSGKSRNETLGTIGLQRFGTEGLLRSLVVSESDRQSGLGGRLVTALEANASCAGVKDLWLLTIDAQRYFESLGYRMMSRESAPESIRQTEEFTGLCPDGAFLMKKTLKQ
ncbi:MAG: arsenic resistance N-acetyltransferase ArsN2 [Woeseia sp.]